MPPPNPQLLIAGLGERARQWAEHNPRAAQAIGWWLSEMMQPPPSEADGSRAERMFGRVMPPNWWQLSIGAQRQAHLVMPATGLCVAWVPGHEIVRALIGAQDKPARDRILVTHADTILDDVRRALTQAAHPQLGTLPSLALEAVHSYRSGAPRACQALCSAALSTVLADHVGETNFAEARRRLEAVALEGTGLLNVRRAFIQTAIRYAILRSDADPPPDGFNRHLTAHGVEAHFTDAHALAALLLIAGALREFHELYSVGDAAMGIDGVAPTVC